MNLNRITGLGRHLDIRYASNRYAVTGSVVAGTVAGAIALLDGDTLLKVLTPAVIAGAAAFAAWATARELDPDHAASATVALPLAFLAFLIDRPSVGAAFGVMLAARVVVRTTGVPPLPADLVFLAGLAGYTALQPAGVIAAVALGTAVAADRFLGPTPRHHVAVGAAIAAAGALVASVFGEWPGWTAPHAAATSLIAAGVITGIAVLAVAAPTSKTDRTREPLSRSRLRWARLLALGTAAAYAAATGSFGVTAMGPVWAAVIAVGLLNLIRRTTARAAQLAD